MTGPPQANLARRVATAVVVLPPLLLGLLIGPLALSLAIVGGAAAAGMVEFQALQARAGFEPRRLWGFLAGAAFFADAGFPGHWGAPSWPLALLGILGASVQGGDASRRLASGAFSLLGAAYLGGLGGTIAALRRLPSPSGGAARIALLLGIVMGADTVAYFVGKALGRHRLAPILSPGKTVEGALGGLLGGAAGALAVRAVALPDLPLGHALVLGVLVAALGALGDLFESLLKRWAGVKDSGGLFPGHGGMLDRLDSLLFGAPLLYYYFGSLR